MDNLYDILEVSPKASKEIIEKAYKTLAKKYHPDLQQGEKAKKDAEEKMKQINEAYETLIDDNKREKYNEDLENEKSKSTNNNEYYQTQDNHYTSENEQNNNVNYNSQQYNEANNRYTRNVQNNSNEENYEKDFQEEVRRERQKAYNDAYNQYLRSMGFRIRERWTFKRVLTLILTIVVLIAIAYILWLIPPIKNKLIIIYQENPVIKIIIDIFISIIKLILSIFKK